MPKDFLDRFTRVKRYKLLSPSSSLCPPSAPITKIRCVIDSLLHSLVTNFLLIYSTLCRREEDWKKGFLLWPLLRETSRSVGCCLIPIKDSCWAKTSVKENVLLEKSAQLAYVALLAKGKSIEFHHYWITEWSGGIVKHIGKKTPLMWILLLLKTLVIINSYKKSYRKGKYKSKFEVIFLCITRITTWCIQ